MTLKELNGSKKHSLADDYNAVHRQLENKIALWQNAKEDIAKAKKMEYYLRLFKYSSIHGADAALAQLQYQKILTADALELIANEVGKRLGIKNYNLFQNQHFWYKKESQSRWGADDIFEAELAKFLQIAAEQAVKKEDFPKINLGVSIIGSQKANIDQRGLKYLEKMPDQLIKLISKELADDSQKIINETSIDSDIITRPEARSAKVDVTGYNAKWVIAADIKPEWQDFINTFTGVNCTVKNYRGNSKYEAIHLGNSNLYKSFYATLTSYLDFTAASAAHMFYHTIYSPNNDKGDNPQHIMHIRFMYELTGNGLYDDQGYRLDEANFFIYNDPTSENIYVRSTKAMIIEAVYKTQNKVNNALYSNVVQIGRAHV